MFHSATRWALHAARVVGDDNNMPFAFETTGMELPGRVRFTLVAGQLAYAAAGD